MSEGQLSRLLRRVKLLARRNLFLDQYGQVVSGSLDPFWQLLEIQLDEIHDYVLDGHNPGTATPVGQFLRYCDDLVRVDWHLVKQPHLDL